MKKTVTVFLLALLCVVLAAAAGSARAEVRKGDTVFFGRYPQSGEADPIEWTVLDARDGKAMLISRYLLDMKVYYHTTERVNWESCPLRQWLNNDFRNAAFSDEEQSAILLTDVDNSDAQGCPDWTKSHGGPDTQDWIYLLSWHEAAEVYFTEDAERICRPTDYALTRGAYAGGNEDAGWWWLRSPGNWQSHVEIVGSNGSFRSVDDDRMYGCVRPVLWVDAESGVFKAEQEREAAAPEEKAYAAEDFTGTWFGFESESEYMTIFGDFRMIRFGADGRLDYLRSGGYYPEYYSGTYRIDGSTLFYSPGEDYEEPVPVRFADGKLILDWYGLCALRRVEDGTFPEDPEACPFLGENKMYYFTQAEDGTAVMNYSDSGGDTEEIPADVFGIPVTEIAKCAYMSRDGLKHVILPDGIRVIGNQAFGSAEELESIRLPDTLKVIKYNAFEYCRSLKEIVIPEGTEYIGAGAFMDCDQLKTVTLPESLKEMDDDAFVGDWTREAVFLVVPGSYAEAWCRDMELNFRPQEPAK